MANKVGHRSQPDEVDIHVGGRISTRRKLEKMSQQRLGDALDLTFQQIQKYESGHNRVSCSKLYAIATALNVDIDYFFEGLPGTTAGDDPMRGETAVRIVMKFNKLTDIQKFAIERLLDAF